MGQFDIKKEVTTLIGQKFGSFYASRDALHNKYGCIKGGDVAANGNSRYFRIYANKKNEYGEIICDTPDVAVANSYYKNSKERLEINDLKTGRTYSTEWAEKLKTDKFNSIMTHGYTIKDNGNGIVDENDTIEGNELKESKTLGEFLREV